MKKVSVILLILSSVVFSQHIFSPLGMNLLELGWRYFNWNPAALRAIGSDGFTLNFEYVTDSRGEDITLFRAGYQSVEPENGLNGELTVEKTSQASENEYSLNYTLAGMNGDYFWGFESSVYNLTKSSTMSEWGLRIGVGIIGNRGNLKGAVTLKDITIVSSNISSIATGQIGAAIGWISDQYALHMGFIVTDFKLFEAYTGVALGVSPAFFSLSFGYATNFSKSTYHLGMGVAWQGKGALVAANFDFVPNPVDFSLKNARDLSLPYRFTIAFKLPQMGE